MGTRVDHTSVTLKENEILEALNYEVDVPCPLQWYLAASMWMYTKAALCDGRKKDPPLDLQPTLATIIESVSWVTEDSLWEHEWITETKVTMRENPILEARHHDIEVPCPLQWALLWFSAPTNLNHKLENYGTKIGKLRKIVNRAIILTCNFAVDKTHTTRAMFVRTTTVALYCAHDKDWDVKKEMQGCDVDDDKLVTIHENASRVSTDN